MKKEKLKSLIKSARKTARKDIKLSLITELKEVADKLGQDSKKFNKEIEKGSKQLAKQLSKKLSIDKSAILDESKETKAANVVEKPKPAAIRKPRTTSSRTAEPAPRKSVRKSKGAARPVVIKDPVVESGNS